MKAVEKAILQSNIGLTPSNDGNVIRLVFPDMTEERRRELVKQAKKMGEDSKVAIRNHRREAMDVIKKMRRHKTVKLGILGKSIAERNERSTYFHKSVTCFHVGDVV